MLTFPTNFFKSSDLIAASDSFDGVGGSSSSRVDPIYLQRWREEIEGSITHNGDGKITLEASIGSGIRRTSIFNQVQDVGHLGDFTFDVDATFDVVDDADTDATSRVELFLFDPSTNGLFAGWSGADSSYYIRYNAPDGGYSSILLPSFTSVKLRIQRVGNTIFKYYDVGAGWVLAGSGTSVAGILGEAEVAATNIDGTLGTTVSITDVSIRDGNDNPILFA